MTDRSEADAPNEAERVVASRALQSRALELVIEDRPLDEALADLMRAVEAHSATGVLGSILLLDGEVLRHGAAPSLPDDYNAAMDGVRIGPAVASCGTAAWTKAAVYVSDIGDNPLWVNFRELALAHGLRACWSTPIMGGGGEVLGVFAMYFVTPREPPAGEDLSVVDLITRTAALMIERGRREEAFRETAERYRLAARATNDAVWDWHFGDNHVTWNEALEATYGHRLADVEPTGDWWIAHIHPDDRARIDHSIHAAIDGAADSWSDEYRFRKADGSYAEVLDRGHIIREPDGEATRMIGAMLDLTRRRQTEAALAESEERLRLSVENAEIGFWDVDVVNDILIWPPRTKAMFGISPDAPATMQDFYNGLHPDDLAATSATYAAAADPERRALYDVEYRTIGKEDGVVRWVAAKGRGVFDADGRCLRVIGTAIDITARKRVEQELVDLNHTLEARIAQAVAQRSEAEEALRQSQKMEAVGQLTGGIAHDFNNMLAVVIGSLNLLSRRIDPGDARAVRYVDAAGEGARRAAVLTQRLLAFSRQQPLQPEPVDANKLVAGMSEILRGSLDADVRLETVLAGGLWRTHADPNQLENVVLNLAINARDAMAGGGKLTIETANGHLDDRYAATHLGVPAGQYVMIAVTDTGAGMSEEVIAKAFDPFFTTKAVGKGTGLGLSQVYGFIKQSGGHVKIYSEPGQGTTVKVYLPRLVGEWSTEAADGRADIPLGDPQECILVVEDEPAVRQFSIDALGELGYRVLEADGAAAALRLLDEHPEIDLMFTDVVMPEVNGAKLAQAARERRPDLRILFTTGYTRNAVVHNGVLDAGVELIGKPFTLEALAAKVRDVLDAPSPRV